MLNIAVVGCGYWGPNLIRNFQAMSGCTVTRVCDTDAGRLAHISGLHPGIQTTTEMAEILEDRAINAVVIATPVGTHYELGRRCLLAGKHALIEKPLARTSSQCRELIDLAGQKGLTLMVDHTFVYSPAVRLIRETVEAGALGEIIYMSSRRLNLGLFQKDINVVWDLAPHDISIMLFALGEEVVALNCQGVAHNSAGIEDVATVSLRFANGGFGNIQTSWIDPRKVRETTVVGTRKMLVYDDTESLEKVRIYDKRVELPPHYDSFAEFHYSYHYGDVIAPYLKQTEPLKAECEHFRDCVASGRKPDSDGEQGLQIVRILEAASASLRAQGARVSLGGSAETRQALMFDRRRSA